MPLSGRSSGSDIKGRFAPMSAVSTLNADLFLDSAYSKASFLRKLLWLFGSGGPKIFLAFFFYIIKHTPVWALPILTARMIDIVSSPETHMIHELWVNIGIYAALLAQNIPIHVLYVRLLSNVIRNVQASFRLALVRRFHQLSMGFHEDHKSGKLQTKVLRDAESIESMMSQVANNVFGSLTTIIFALIVTLRKEPLIAAFYLFAIPLAIILLRSFWGRMKANNEAYRKELEQMNSNLSEMIEMMPITRGHGEEERELKKLDARFIAIRMRGIMVDTFNALFGSSAFVSYNFFQMVTLGVSTFMAYHKYITVGDVVLYNSFFAMIMNGVNNILAVLPELNKGIDALSSANEVISSPDIERNEGKSTLKSFSGKYDLEEVTFTYPSAKTPSIQNLNLRIDGGEVLAFVGPSGSGKSTLMNLLIGFRRPEKGRILLDGIDMDTLDLRTYRRFLGIVPQNILLYSGTIRDNITFGHLGFKEKDILNALEIANALEFIQQLPQGLETMLGEHGAKLSGGQKQRIAIARAVIRDPRVLIFDEATSALDPLSVVKINDALSRVAKNRTVLIVSHNLLTVDRADRIVVMKEGSIAEEGSLQTLIRRKGEFYKLRELHKNPLSTE
jgi:ATP-binding cassette subfamily B protein